MAEIEVRAMRTTAELEQAEIKGCPARFRRGKDRRQGDAERDPESLFKAKRQTTGSHAEQDEIRASSVRTA